MQAVVKTPHIEIAVNGRIPKRLLTVLKEEYGAAVRILQDEDEHRVDVFQSEWDRGIKEKLTPGTNMRAYRENRDMTQIELGRLLGGIPRQHISNMERGTRAISKKVALQLSKIFEISVEKFIA